MDTFEEINLKGFVDEYIDPSLDLFTEIEKLKKEKNETVFEKYWREFLFKIFLCRSYFEM